MGNLTRSIYLVKKNILKKIEQGRDIFDRGYQIKKIEIDNTYPEYIYNNQVSLKNWIV